MTYLRQTTRYHDVIHQPEFQWLLSLQRRPRPTERQTHHFPGPQWWNHPLHHIPCGVTFAIDRALLVHLIAAGQAHLGGDRQVPARQDYPGKRNLQVALSDEMPRFLIRFQMSSQHATSREQRLAELLHSSQVAQHWVTDCGCRRREIRLV